MPFVEDWTTCPLKVATELELVTALLRAGFKLSSFWKSARTSRAVCASSRGRMTHQRARKETSRVHPNGPRLWYVVAGVRPSSGAETGEWPTMQNNSGALDV